MATSIPTLVAQVGILFLKGWIGGELYTKYTKEFMHTTETNQFDSSWYPFKMITTSKNDDVGIADALDDNVAHFIQIDDHLGNVGSSSPNVSNR